MKANSFIQELEHLFAVTPANIREMVAEFHSEMKRGLSGAKSSLKMLPSFVARPRGTEKGRYLALDLGGTNLRILAVELDGNGKAKIIAADKFVVDKSVMCGSGDALFDFIAQCVTDFLNRSDIRTSDELALGFTFSFPVEQTGIASGRLIAWTKGFGASGVVGEDVVVLLNKALARKVAASIKITALVNDTVGTLVTKGYSDPSCDMGVILGTGTNACYAEKIATITKDKTLGQSGEMIINMEWGNFSKLTQTTYDKDLDRASQNAGFQFMEKMVSGMYLGELTRRIMLDMAQKGALFSGIDYNSLRKDYAFKTEHMSSVATGNFDFLEGFGLSTISAHDKDAIRRICQIVSLRAARISGMAIASVIAWMDPNLENSHTVGIDGSLFEGYPGFKENIIGVFEEMFGIMANKIRIEVAKDGSGVGAAITAAIAATANYRRTRGKP